MRRYKGSTIVEFAIYVLIIILISAVPLIGSKVNIGRNQDVEQLKYQAIVIDKALAMWYSSHSQKYPDSLPVLQTLTFIPNSILLSNFSYSVNSDGTYTLTANLPTGSSYKSPGSK